jgi:hypothetical protein
MSLEEDDRLWRGLLFANKHSGHERVIVRGKEERLRYSTMANQ